MRIVAAAILKEGALHVGYRHNRIINSAAHRGDSLKNCPQGFITTDGKFVDRLEGARIALGSGQIVELGWPPNLYSEDLY